MVDKNDTTSQSFSKSLNVNTGSLLHFVVPSTFGLLLFVIPVAWNGKITVPIAFLAEVTREWLQPWLPLVAMIIIMFAWLGAAYTRWLKPSKLLHITLWNALFVIPPFSFVTRTLGFIFALSTYFKFGPEWLWLTGSDLLLSLIPNLLVVFTLAGLLLPLLIDFGLPEFFGALLSKVMRPIFTLPGRSSINCMASWLGDGTIGLLMTKKQYEAGYFTKREAIVISTTFTAVSITFSFVVLSNVRLAHMFFPFYTTVTFVGMVAAVIMPRIPPLSRKPDTYSPGVIPMGEEVVPSTWSSWKWALYQAIGKAYQHKGMGSFIGNSSKNVIDLWIGVIPVVMAIGTLTTALAKLTPIFKWLGWPFIPMLQLFGLPEAEAASQTILVGFADMFLPTFLGASVDSEMTRFVIAALSVTQLIYMSEVGGLLLASKLPISLKDLISIFLLRTLLTLPIIVVVAHLLFSS